jgi:uncharacterized membrane protein HdeD (DUF308 family)
MNGFQRLRKFLSGIGMLLGSLALFVDPVNGYYIIAFFMSLSMLLSGMRQLVYYAAMARHMVGGRSILYNALILTDLGFFTITAMTIPKIYLICHLLISHAFSGLVDMMKAYEDMKMHAASWRMSLVYGMGNLLTAVAAFACIINSYEGMVSYVYGIGLAYSAIMQMASAFRKTAIIYIQ